MKPKPSNLTAKELKKFLFYDYKSGDFIWIARNKTSPVTIGSIAGKKKNGYIYIKINSRAYLAHRLAWLWMTGYWPIEYIDHKDLNGLNNKWSNLREASHGQNRSNSKQQKHRSLPKGAYKNTSANTYFSVITFNNEQIYLGAFPTPAEASNAYYAAAKKLHGQFARVK